MLKKESRLIDRCKQGDVQAQKWMYKKYAPLMFGICLRYVNNRMQAEDILQETFITVFDKIKQLNSNNSFEAWAKRITINNALIFLKSQQHIFYLNEINDASFNQENTNEEQDIKERILEFGISQNDMLHIISELPIGYRTVFNLYVFEKYKHSDIAKKLEISEGTSKSQLLRARKQIQKKLNELVLEKEKSRKKVLFVSMLVIMNDNNYIDKLAYEKLNNFSSKPPVINNNIINTSANAKQLSYFGAKGKLITLFRQKIFWIASVAVTGSSIAFIVLHNKTNKLDSSSNNIETPISKSTGSMVITDTTNNAINYIISDSLKTLKQDLSINKKQKLIQPKINDTASNSIVIKKEVKIVRKKYIVDTVIVTDTLR